MFKNDLVYPLLKLFSGFMSTKSTVGSVTKKIQEMEKSQLNSMCANIKCVGMKSMIMNKIVLLIVECIFAKKKLNLMRERLKKEDNLNESKRTNQHWNERKITGKGSR